ncbi:hypothetical protein O6H91_Y241800 [Diphasiastrum complanatum]|nr:hypothetical protein O6H91_Y241800 [Diphasiastrum complanatum]KAJ7294672.1 hypothetical protein O6H91_Y241800 [Diphasiastrum complanatum]
MSKSLADYGEKKSCATTTARRLADFLGDAMVKDKGLSCRYIVARDPQGAPVSERAVPVAIFETESDVIKVYLRKWCKVSADVAIRSIVDWAYYRQRLNSAIQKIITIPAAMQKVANPVPRVPHPDWLWKKVREKDDKYRQKSIRSIFSSKSPVRDQGIEVIETDAMLGAELIGDLEDIASGKEHVGRGTHKQAQPQVISKVLNSLGNTEHKQVTNLQIHDDQTSSAQNGMKSPDKKNSYEDWLEHKKRKWKEIRLKCKKLRQGVGAELRESTRHNVIKSLQADMLTHQRSRKTVRTFFRDKEAALTHSHWQILQLLPAQRCGEFTAWVMAGGDMFKLGIKIPRVFYLNTHVLTTEDYLGKRVVRVLPHGHPCSHLIEVTIEEEQFKAAGRKLAAHLSDPEVEGVYETKMPLVLQGLLQLGCVCTVDAKARNCNSKDGWSLDDLHMKTTTECTYLSDSLTFIYLYHSCSDTRGMYALYAPIANTVLVIVVNPFSNKEISSAQLERNFRDSLRGIQGLIGDVNMEHSNLSFRVDYAINNSDAGKQLQRAINEYRDQHPGPTIAMIECPSVAAVTSAAPALAEFPHILVSSNARDSQYQALGWQPVAAKVAMQRCGASCTWLDERIRLSRYAHVPLGNFEYDWLLFIADLFYARALRDHQQVLWISDDGIPDLGGMPEDEPSFADEVQQPVLSCAGAYRSVTIELKVNHLAVNALLKSSQINEMEGGALLGFELDLKGNSQQLAQTCWDESFSCAPAFRVLKQMVQGWVSDAVSSQNVFADALLQHLYRWLCSPQSKLHDPALHRILHKVMQKAFALLLAELRKLGATIVFANFSRIIIATGKHNKIAAQGYCAYLLKTLQTRELFEWIELEPQRYWHSLLFMDQFNFGGIQAKVSENINHLEKAETFDCSQEFPTDELSQPDIVSSWNIAEYLPKLTQEYFIVIVSEYIYLPWKHSQEQAARLAASRLASTFCTPSVTVAAAADIQAEDAKFLKEQIESYFTDKLLRIVRDVQRHFNAKRQESSLDAHVAHEFPKLAGSHLPMGDAALEFIKHVCAVLSLDQQAQHAVQVLRKNLLRLVHVREFSEESQFRDPCLSFTLPNVICSYCNDCRDLDLCRDAALLERDWRCAVPQCGQPYNREGIENALLQIVRQRERLYHLQDLICSKCRQVKASHLLEQCGCGGAYECSENFVNFNRRMMVFYNIAAFHGFELLQECVAWVIESSLHLKPCTS